VKIHKKWVDQAGIHPTLRIGFSSIENFIQLHKDLVREKVDKGAEKEKEELFFPKQKPDKILEGRLPADIPKLIDEIFGKGVIPEKGKSFEALLSDEQTADELDKLLSGVKNTIFENIKKDKDRKEQEVLEAKLAYEKELKKKEDLLMKKQSKASKR
jgi:hypothetical protein